MLYFLKKLINFLSFLTTATSKFFCLLSIKKILNLIEVEYSSLLSFINEILISYSPASKSFPKLIFSISLIPFFTS